MGLIYVDVTIRNPADPTRSWNGPFLVDTGAIDSLVPRPRLEAIGLAPKGQRVYETADGREITMDITTGDIEVMGEITGGRIIFGAADAEPLLGVTALESAGIEIDPQNQQLKKLPSVRLKRADAARRPIPGDRRAVGNGPPRDPRLRGVDSAMRRAAAAATRRAARSTIAAAGSGRSLTGPAAIDEQHPSFDADVKRALTESERTLVWVADSIDGMRLPGLPHDKRLQLAVGCLHTAIEHGQAIVVLVQEKCFGSALALQRPLFEAFSRGLWLRYAATDHDIARAGRDKFPGNSKIVQALEPRFGAEFPYLTEDTWRTLCSYTHTGFQQIGARLSPDGLRSNYRREEVHQALHSSDLIQLASATELAVAAGNAPLANSILDRIKQIAR